jgi:hypothetical protein
VRCVHIFAPTPDEAVPPNRAGDIENCIAIKQNRRPAGSLQGQKYLILPIILSQVICDCETLGARSRSRVMPEPRCAMV